MISKNDFNDLKKAFDEDGYKKFAEALENGKYELIQDNNVFLCRQ